MSVIDSLSLGGTTYSLRDNDGRAIIAGTESSTTSAHAYSAGDYFILNDTLYEATAAIAVGGTITVGTNCQATTVCGEVGELKSDFNDSIAEVKGDLSTYEKYFIGRENPLNNLSWTDGYAIGADGGVVANGSFHYSSLIPVEPKIYTFIYIAGAASNTVRIHGYDANGDWVQQISTFASGSNTTKTIILPKIPSAVSYLRFSIGKNHTIVTLYTGDTVQTQINKSPKFCDLVVCGHDATDYQKALAQAMSLDGYGYICNSTELDTGINTFIDAFMNTEKTIYFFGTIRTSVGIHKHPKHNLVGYDCTLKMGDNLGNDYVSCITLTTGGIPFATKQAVSHNFTFIKGFHFDGNCENNKVDDVYKFKSIYGSVVCGQIYHNEEYPYDETQSCTDLVLEDISAVETMRGVVVGEGWRCRNLYIERSVTDHALYVAGGSGAIVENVYCTKRHYNGAIAISGQSWVPDLKVRNIVLRNITLDECIAINGPLVDIRGHFSTWGNDKTIDDVVIDGLFIKKHNLFQEGVAITIGTHSTYEQTAGYTLKDYPLNITINNLVADIKLYNSLCRITNARVKMENSFIRFSAYRYDRPLINLQSRDILKGAFDFGRMAIVSDATEDIEHAWNIIAVDNSAQTHDEINGLNIDDMYIEGISNYYLFTTTANTYPVTIKNLSAERIIATPQGTINPSATQLSIGANDYYIVG